MNENYKMRLCLQRTETFFVSVHGSNGVTAGIYIYTCTLYIFITDVTAIKETKIT